MNVIGRPRARRTSVATITRVGPSKFAEPRSRIENFCGHLLVRSSDSSAVGGAVATREEALARFARSTHLLGDVRTPANPGISLDLPDDVDADVDARWVNGRLETDLPLELIGRVSRRSARGALGDGGPELNLRTVNGSIHLF